MSTPKLIKGRLAAILTAGMLFAAVGLMTSGCGNTAPAPAPVKKEDKSKVAQASTNDVVVIELKSEFDDDIKTSRDPFFPKSKRRTTKVASGKAVAQVPTVAELKLRGVIGSPGRFIAMINDKTFAEGDKSQVLVAPNQYLVVKVTKITDKTATVSVDGEAAPRQLSLEVEKEARK